MFFFLLFCFVFAQLFLVTGIIMLLWRRHLQIYTCAMNIIGRDKYVYDKYFPLVGACVYINVKRVQVH